MIKVVIADDEVKVCQLIQSLVDWAALDMQIVGTAHNGLEALELVEQFSPDLMVTDIRMPGCDGLELIRRAKQLNDRLEFIIVSGYGHFEYAQTAIKYGVGDYLLKPIKRDELTATLEKMRERYRLRTQQLSEEEQLRLRLQSDIDRLRTGLFTDFLLSHRSGTPPLALEEINRRYHYSLKPGCFAAVGIKVDGSSDMLSSGAFGVLQQKLLRILRSILQPVCTELEFCFENTRAWGILNYPPENGKAVRRQLKTALDELLVHKNLFPQQFTIGLGRVVETTEELPLSFLDARRALEQRLIEGAGKLLSAPPEESAFPRRRELLVEMSKAVEAGLEILDPAPVAEAITHMEEELLASEETTGTEVLYLSGEVCSTFVLFARNFRYELPGADSFAASFLALADQCSSTHALLQELNRTLSDAIVTLAASKRQEDTRPIRTAKHYIQEHAAEPLTLEEVSSVVNFNASYFSSLFKKETGQNFVEYLSEVRMSRAKELLKETDLPINKICEQVGYSDLKHFTKSFKKHTGIKPGEFRKLYS